MFIIFHDKLYKNRIFSFEGNDHMLMFQIQTIINYVLKL